MSYNHMPRKLSSPNCYPEESIIVTLGEGEATSMARDV